ncbi:MAG: phospholipase D-like domain-containing protein [Candidatus Babeliales bacterium]
MKSGYKILKGTGWAYKRLLFWGVGLSVALGYLLCEAIPHEDLCLGKTHFITYDGSPQNKEMLSSEKKGSLIQEETVRILFGPDDNLAEELLSLIQKEHKSIKIAVYMLTDKHIAEALVAAHNRGVYIEIIAEPTVVYDCCSKCRWLYDHHITLYLYSPVQKNIKNTLLHMKVVLFEDNKNHKAVVWVGSPNLTQSGLNKHGECVLIITDNEIFGEFMRQFERIKNKSKQYKE